MIKFHKKFGLALGGGGAKGIAHIGVLKYLEEAGIKIDYLAGTSMGALVGALYAAGNTIDELVRLTKDFSLKDQLKLVDVGLPQGLFKGNKIVRFMEKYIPVELTFADLEMPFAVTAVDLMSGKVRVISEGNVLEAVRASISYPFFFKPVVNKNDILVDGGILLNIPIDVLYEMGANFIAAVRVSHFMEFEEQDEILKSDFMTTPAFVKILLRTLSVATKNIENAYLAEVKPDVMIDVEIPDVSATNFLGAKHLIERGYEAATKIGGKLKKSKVFYIKKRGTITMPRH